MKVTVKPNSEIIKKKIGELNLAARMGVDIIAIRRNHDWILNPKKTETRLPRRHPNYPRGTLRH